MKNETKFMDSTTITKYFKDQKPPIINNLKSKYEDPYFPPNLNSLQSKDSKGNFIDKEEGPSLLEELGISKTEKLTWKRGSDIKSDMKIFNDKITIKEIRQGELGDCYFLSSLAALSTLPYLIREKFRLTKPNKFGYLEVILFIDGEWQIIFIDDFFPYDKYEFAFAKPYENIFWGIILEKVWAKVNGGYSNIIGGVCEEPIEALTGFPSETIEHSKIEKNELFNIIEGGNRFMLMTASSNEDVDKDETGIESGHAYTIIQGKKWEEKGIYLIRLRNPWGEGEWKGNYGANSKKWNKELIEYFGENKKNDGVFWISIDDYMTHFRATHVTYLFFDSIIKNYYFDYEGYFKEPSVFNLYLENNGKTSIRVIFRNWRFNREIKNPMRPFVIVLGKYNEKREITKLYSKYEVNSDINFLEELEKGYYFLWLYCSYNDVKNDPKFKYTLQITSVKSTNFICEYICKDSSFLFIQNMILNNFQIEKKDLLSNKDEYYIGSNTTLKGIYGAILFNKSSDKWLNVKVNPKLKNVKLFPPYADKSKIEVLIPPKQKACVLGMNISTSCSYSLSTSASLKVGIKDPIPNEPNFNNYLRFNLSNELSDLMGRAEQYHYVSKDSIGDIPKFEKNEFIHIANQFLRKSSLTEAKKIQNDKIIKEEMAKKYEKEFEIIKKLFPELERDKNIKKYNDIIECPSGTYIGEINKESGKFRGRGLYVYKNGFKYLGYFNECIKDVKGLIIDSNNKKRYFGEFKNDQREGHGEVYFENNEKYIGEFKNNVREGKGKYYFSNGFIWEGNFKNNMKNGVGVLYKENGGEKILAEFENDHFIGKYDINQNQNNNNQNNNKNINNNQNNINQNNNNNINQNQNNNNQTNNKNINNNQNNNNQNINNNQNQNNINQNNNKDINNNQTQNINNNINPNPQKKYINTPTGDTNINYNNSSNDNISTSSDNNKNDNKSNNTIEYKRPEIQNNITVSQLNFFKRDESEEKHELYLKKLKELNLKDPFMLSKVLNLNSNKEENLEYISNNQIIFLGGLNSLKQKEGCGALFKGNRYYIGHFSNDLPIGTFDIYGMNRKKIYSGEIDNNYNLINGKYSFKYYLDGSVYFGQLRNENPDGKGILYYVNKAFWSGNFKNGKFDGRGKYFFQNGVLSQYITYNENQYVSSENIIIEDYNYENTSDFFYNNQKIGKKLLSIKYNYYFEAKLKWIKMTLPNKDEYLGQVDINGNKNGKGCIIYNNNQMVKYYIGFFQNNQRFGKGTLYDENWNIIYTGEFKNDKKNGFGIMYNKKNKYSGYFSNDKANGKGVHYLSDGSIYQGNFLNTMRHGKGFLINPKEKMIQEVKYNNNNIIKQYSPIFCNNPNYISQKRKNLNYIYNKYPKYTQELMNLKETPDCSVLQFVINEDEEGFLYIGEFNSIGFKHGRGYLIYPDRKRHYIGYFYDNLKQGKGNLFSDETKIEYSGNFEKDFPYGEGIYYLDNGCIINGKFNYVGGGNGSIIFPNKTKWVGLFYGLLMNSEGDYYDSSGKFIEKRKYKLSQLVN